jgi:hypothetical protein
MSLATAILEASSNQTIALPSVEAELNYLAPSRAKPHTYTFEPPGGGPRSNIVNEPHAVAIRNMRAISSLISLDQEGFGLITHRSATRDFANDEEIRRTYYPESEALMKDLTGADRVFIFDHTVRRRVPGQEDRRGEARQPVARVHVDHTDRSGPQRVRDLLPDEADELLHGRVQIINLWRPIHVPALDAPLAVADAGSVAPHDLVASDLIYPDRRGEVYSVRFNPAHQWFYAPRMEPDEALLLKCYDSATDGRARFAPHTAFLDPTAPAGAPPRESIEIRTLVFHGA